MDSESWRRRLASASKRYQAALQSRSEMLMGIEDMDVDDDIREEFSCPFCSDYFDIIGLCCHIDEEHSTDGKNGVCPICAIRVSNDMVAHITLQHGNVFKMQRKRKSRKGGSYSTLTLLRKELREGNLQSLLGNASCLVSTNATPDPLLSSFILPITDDVVSGSSQYSTEMSSISKSSDINTWERKTQPSPLSKKDRQEKANRSEFVQGMLLSTILEDII